MATVSRGCCWSYQCVWDMMASLWCPVGRFPPSFIHQVIITGLNKLYDYVIALKMASDADRA